MRLTVLGRSGRYPEMGGGTSAYLLRTDKVNILIDMGSGAIAGFQRYIGIEDIDAIVFSHLHGDHMADFLPFNYMVAHLDDRIRKPIDVYRPNAPAEIVSLLGKDRDKLHFHDIVAGEKVHIGDVTIQFIKVNHPVLTYAMRISEDGGRILLYTGDTTLFDGIERLFDGADVVLGDACILERNWTKKSPHIAVSELARYTANVGAHLILTHLPDNDEEIGEIFSEALSRNADSEVARVGETYTI